MYALSISNLRSHIDSTVFTSLSRFKGNKHVPSLLMRGVSKPFGKTSMYGMEDIVAIIFHTCLTLSYGVMENSGVTGYKTTTGVTVRDGTLGTMDPWSYPRDKYFVPASFKEVTSLLKKENSSFQ